MTHADDNLTILSCIDIVEISLRRGIASNMGDFLKRKELKQGIRELHSLHFTQIIGIIRSVVVGCFFVTPHRRRTRAVNTAIIPNYQNFRMRTRAIHFPKIHKTSIKRKSGIRRSACRPYLH